MAIEKVVDIKVNTREAVTETEKLTKAIERIADTQVEANKQAEKSAEDAKKRIEEQKKATEEARKPLNRLKAGFENLNKTLKANAIGLVIGAVAGLTAAFNSNNDVARVFKETFETISLVFGEFIGGVVSAVKEVGKMSNGFESTKKTVSSLLDIALFPLKAVFLGLKSSVLSLQLAWEKSIFGGRGKDKERVEELTNSLKDTKEEIKKLGKETFESAKDLGKNIGGAIDEVFKTTTKAVNNTTKISIKNSNDLAKTLVKMREESELAIATNELILKTKQKEAEEQRIIRDNVELDISTRKKANEELKKILEESNKLQLANAQKTVDLAELEKKASNDSLSSKVNLLKAELAYQDVLETTKGFLAEQDTNRASLNAEAIEYENSRIEAESERAKAKRDFEAEQIENEVKRIEQQKANLEIENQNILDDLERKKQLYALGTQARQDAEQEYLDKKQELDQKEIELGKQLLEAQKKQNEEKKQSDQAVADAKSAIDQAQLDNVKNAFGLIAQIDKKSKALQAVSIIAENATGAAKQIINTRAANAGAKAKYALLPGGLALAAAEITANNISLGLGLASTATATAKALTALGQGGGVDSGGAGAEGGGGISAPSFNLVTGTGTDQIADSIQNQDRPIKAYVVSSDMTSQQATDRNAVETASL